MTIKNKSGIKTQKPKTVLEGNTRLNLLTRFKNWKYNFVNPAMLIVADMELITGDYELHVVEVRNNSFVLFGSRYLVNPEYLTYDRTLKMYRGRYHQNCTLPLKTKINV